jgi:hypothetical protein
LKPYRILIAVVILSLIIIIIPNIANAQIDPAGDPDAPIDGGLGILLAAGIGYGIKQIRDRKNIQSKE